jgi:16S rRNA (uracil1498-N3)-methyltransferase
VRIPRIFTDHELAVDQEITLSQDTSRHLISVLRVQAGAQLILFNGDGSEYSAHILATAPKKAIVQIDGVSRGISPSPLAIILAIGMSKGDRMDWVIQKAVELGVTKVVPLFTERSEIKLTKERAAKKTRHWQKIVQSACEQSGQNLIPEIDLPNTFQQALCIAASHKFILDPLAKHSLIGELTRHTEPPPQSTLIISGPEGGFSPEEIKQAEHNVVLPVSMGPRILRTETAPVAALSLLQAQWGDWL